MSEFLLEPDDIEPERPERSTPPRMVSTGLAPTAEVPRAARKGKARTPSLGQCPQCGRTLVYGVTPEGTRRAVEVGRPCYVVDWQTGEDQVRLLVSRAYAVHDDCGGMAPGQGHVDKECPR